MPNRLTDIQQRSYTYKNGNELLTQNGTSFSYDANGNMVSKTDSSGTTSYVYDSENRLIELRTPNAQLVIYKYDPFGRRIEKNVNGTITRYVYDREDILFELDGSGNVITEYLHGPGIDEPIAMIKNNQTYYYHADGLGSIIAITDSTGNVVLRYEYDSFGNITYQQDSNFVQPYTYTGREYDNESGLYYYRARYYDAKVGRFLQQDPFRGFLRYPLTQNRYPYALNNPVNMIDATGEGPIAIGACIGLAAYDAISTVVTLNRLTNEVLEIQKKIKELTDSCKSTEDYLKVHEEVEKLQKQAIEKIEERTRELAKGSLYGIPIGVFCAAAPYLPF